MPLTNIGIHTNPGNKVLIGILALVVIGSGFYLVQNTDTQSVSPPDSDTQPVNNQNTQNTDTNTSSKEKDASDSESSDSGLTVNCPEDAMAVCQNISEKYDTNVKFEFKSQYQDSHAYYLTLTADHSIGYTDSDKVKANVAKSGEVLSLSPAE